MITNGEGSPFDESEQLKKERRRSVGGIGNGLINFYPPPEYADDGMSAPHGKYKKRIRFSEDFRTRTQGQLQPKTGVKKLKVSLTHFPRGLSRRNEEVSLIRQQNLSPADIDMYGRKSPTHHLRNARYAKRREARYRTVHSPGYYKNRRNWFFRTKIKDDTVDMDDLRSTSNLYDPCFQRCLTDDLTPGTYMVQVEPESDEDCDIGDGTCTIERRQSTSEKCYYIFERQPYKVKFLNYVPTPFEDFVLPPQTSVNPILNEVSLKLRMPPFRCIPPDCREVVYCKYFQCTSLGFFPDSRNCRKYFFCDLNSNGFVLYHMLCPKGRIFDPIIRECRLREIMDERDVQRCRVEAAKLRRSEKMRIKKNDCEDLIKYKAYPKMKYRNGKPRNVVNYSPNERWKRRRLYRIPGEESDERRNATMQKVRGGHMMHQPDAYDTWRHPKYRRKKMWSINPVSLPLSNYSKPIKIPKYCEMFFTMTLLPTTTTTTTTTATTKQTTESTSPATTETTSTEATTEATLSQLPTTPTSTTTVNTTPSPCSQLATKNKTRQSTNKSQYYLGDLESDAYQDDMQDYYDGYYDGDYAPENSREGDYEWLRQGLTEYLDKLKDKKERKMEDKDKTRPDSYNGQSTPAQQKDLTENQNQQEKVLPKLTDQESDTLLTNDSDRGKRSREKSSASTEVTDQTLSSIAQNLPDFEKCYKEEKLKNLDGYPCKKYARYPDKFDNICYYECGAQPDGNMRIEHKCCLKGEEFSPHYLECVGTEYLKVAHRKRSASKDGKSNKNRIPEPEDNYEDDKDVPNEWLDESRTNKVPNEFKSKTKNTLRIFHLQCKRNSSAAENGEQSEDDHLRGRKHNTARAKKKDVAEEQIKADDEEEDEYDDEDEEEEYEEEYEDGADDDGNEKSTVEMESSSEKTESIESSSATTVSEPQTTSKVLLDADIRVGRDFENALRNILGKAKEQGKYQKRNSRDSILINLSENKPHGRRKRNFLKGIFSKKGKTNLDYPDKEGVVSMLTLINGLPSEYERDALLQKLERRKMMNSHLFRIQQGKRKRKKTDNENTYKNEMMSHKLQQINKAY